MSTILFPAPIFGPVHSRRLGVSLGINLLPPDGKVCSFDCIYCECGFNADRRPKSKLPSREEVYKTLKEKLVEMKVEGTGPDVITFAGNGEPTSHPQFADIIDDTLSLRDIYFPAAKVGVLSNGTMLHKPEVFNALSKVDNNIQKLDTVDQHYIDIVDRPSGNYDVNNTIKYLKAFQGKLIIQTMFLKGTFDGVDIDNTTDTYVLPWLDIIRDIAPEQVTIYTIDRETPGKHLQKASPEDLDRIMNLLGKNNIPATVSY